MNRVMKRIAAVAATALILLACIPSYALAMVPPPLVIDVTNAPDDLAYLDILVPKDITVFSDSKVNPYIIDKYPNLAESELATLDSEGYVSFSMHYNFEPAELERPSDGSSWRFENLQMMSIMNLKIVTMNKDGDILKISDVITLRQDNIYASITYNYESNTAEVTYSDPLSSLFGVIMLVVAAAVIVSTLLIGTKTLIALPFKVRPFWVVPIISLVSQTIFVFAALFIAILLPYKVATVAALALLIATAEYFVYRAAASRPKGLKLLIFVLVANLAPVLIILGAVLGFLSYVS